MAVGWLSPFPPPNAWGGPGPQLGSLRVAVTVLLCRKEWREFHARMTLSLRGTRVKHEQYPYGDERSARLRRNRRGVPDHRRRPVRARPARPAAQSIRRV